MSMTDVTYLCYLIDLFYTMLVNSGFDIERDILPKAGSTVNCSIIHNIGMVLFYLIFQSAMQRGGAIL